MIYIKLFQHLDDSSNIACAEHNISCDSYEMITFKCGDGELIVYNHEAGERQGRILRVTKEKHPDKNNPSYSVAYVMNHKGDTLDTIKAKK